MKNEPFSRTDASGSVDRLSTRATATVKKTVTGLIVAGYFASLLQAATYYVAPQGNDANPGTEGQPWRTIQKAANTVVAGDTVLVQPGYYAERVRCATASGTAENPIRFIANGTVTNYGWYFSKPYYFVQGFSVNGLTLDGPAFYIEKTAHGTTVLSNVVALAAEAGRGGAVGMVHGDWGRNPSNCVIRGNHFLDTKFHALSMQGQGHLVEGNYFRGTNGWDAIRANAANTVYRLNVFTNWSNLVGNSNHPDVIQAFSSNGEIATNVVFEKNLIVNCIATQFGMFENQWNSGNSDNISNWTFRNNLVINCEAAMHIYAPHFNFYNNTFYRSGRNTAGPFLFRYSTTRGSGHYGQVYNNLFVECGSDPSRSDIGWYGIEAGVTGVQCDYNLVIGIGAGLTKKGFQSAGREMNGINGNDPLFVNPDALDFRLQSISPAITAGKTVSGFNDDLVGVTRPQGVAWDMGAYEFRTDTPAAPRGLRVISFER